MSVSSDHIVSGDRIRFASQSGNGWWLVRDRDDRYIVATRQAPFAPRGELQYTVVDLMGWLGVRRHGVGGGVVRSSLNTLGGGWDIAADGGGAELIIPALRAHERGLSVRRVINVESIERAA